MDRHDAERMHRQFEGAAFLGALSLTNGFSRSPGARQSVRTVLTGIFSVFIMAPLFPLVMAATWAVFLLVDRVCLAIYEGWRHGPMFADHIVTVLVCLVVFWVAVVLYVGVAPVVAGRVGEAIENRVSRMGMVPFVIYVALTATLSAYMAANLAFMLLSLRSLSTAYAQVSALPISPGFMVPWKLGSVVLAISLGYAATYVIRMVGLRRNRMVRFA